MAGELGSGFSKRVALATLPLPCGERRVTMAPGPRQIVRGTIGPARSPEGEGFERLMEST